MSKRTKERIDIWKYVALLPDLFIGMVLGIIRLSVLMFVASLPKTS